MSKLAERLNLVLAESGVSRFEFAKKIGTSHQTVSRWCAGEREPNFDMLLLICKELDEDPNYLLGWSE